jgi:hypothetical protein
MKIIYYNSFNLIPEIKCECIYTLHVQTEVVCKSFISVLKDGKKVRAAVVSHIMCFKFINIKSCEKMF